MPGYGWKQEILDDWRNNPRKLHVRQRLALVAVASAFGLALDLASKVEPSLLEIRLVLRFVTLDLVSIFVLLWPVWLALSLASSTVWWVLTLARNGLQAPPPAPRYVRAREARKAAATRGRRALLDLQLAVFASRTPWKWLLDLGALVARFARGTCVGRGAQRVAGLVVRNLGHLEAAFVSVVIVTLPCWRLAVTIPLVTLILALGLYAAGALGNLYLARRRGDAAQAPSDGDRLAARRCVVGIVTVVGIGFLTGYAWSQWSVLLPLTGTYVISVTVRLLCLRSVRKRCDPAALEATSALTVSWKRYDWVATGLALVAILGLRVDVYRTIAAADEDDKDARARLSQAPLAAPWPRASSASRGVALFIVSDSQFHEVRGRRVGVHRNLVDRFVSVAVRPIELDLLSGVTFRHFGDVYRRLQRDRGDMMWTHLGDFGDLGCPDELRRAGDYLKAFAEGHEARLAALLPGNHDSTFVGNFVWHPDWEEACRPAGKGSGTRFLVDKAAANEAVAAIETPWLPPGSVSTLWHPLDGPSTNALVSVRVLDATGDEIVGAFLDTSDFTIVDAPVALGLAGEQGNISDDQATFVERALGDHPRAKVIFFMHHPFAALSRPSRKRLLDLLGGLGDRVVAIVSAHTHLAALREVALPSGRPVPELVVGSILNPPQEAGLLEVLPDGRFRFTTIPAVDWWKAATLPGPLSADVCPNVLAAIRAEPRCAELVDGPADALTLDPDEQKSDQQRRAVALLRCLGINLGSKAAPDDGSCPRTKHTPTGAECPLDAPDLFPEVDAAIARGWSTAQREKLICLAQLGALLQGRKYTGWHRFGDAIAHANDGLPARPMVVESDPVTGGITWRSL